MVWFVVDDALYDHPKVKAIPRAGGARKSALGLWTLAGSWNARYHHDGLIPIDQIDELGGTPKDVEHLTRVGLWHAPGFLCPYAPEHCTPAPPGFVTFHQWHANGQQTKDQVEAKRANDRERQRRRRARKHPPEPTEGTDQ